jgi:Ser/Thr protein kinase RdoA (MazF antagonist)
LIPSAVLEAGWGISSASLTPLGAGHINDTLLATLADGGRYVLQRINERVFADPVRVMENLARVQAHLRTRAAHLIPPLINTSSGERAWHDPSGGWWRLWGYVAESRTINTTRDPRICHSAALAFGRFQTLLADLPGEPMVPAIPGFLELDGYLARFDEVAAGVPDAERSVAAACEGPGFIDERRCLISVLPKGDNLIHGDCKLNNLLFEQSGTAVKAIVDLDTIMIGHWAWDFGDLARSVLSGALDAGDRDAELALFAALAEGFLEGTERDLDPETLAIAPVYVAFMLGIRFLTDHLEGDGYFKVSKRGENLERARRQFELARRLPVEALAASVRSRR